MVLIAEDPGGGGGGVGRKGGGGGKGILLLTGKQNGGVASYKTLVDEDDSSVDSNDARNYDDYDDDDVYQEFEELDFSTLPDLPDDARSIVSDDSFYPPDEHPSSSSFSSLWALPAAPISPEPLSFFKACCNNNAVIVKVLIRQGVSEEEVKETDRNGRSGLIAACYQGYVDVVIALSQCPYIDVNWQDNEGNTALITAAQAGHIMISNYLLSYFPGLDLERRNVHGLTALMKAAIQGRADCVRSLMMAGASVEARDFGRRLTSLEWAGLTGRWDTVQAMSRVLAAPCAAQFCDSFSPEWPLLAPLVARSQEPRPCWTRLAQTLCCCSLRLGRKVSPVEEGVLDHMVQVTTSLRSPLVAPACRTVSPGSPPRVGKRRYAVQEILRRQRVDQLRRLGPERLQNYRRLFQNSRVLLVARHRDRRASLQPPELLRGAVDVAGMAGGALRRSSLLPLHMMRRSSVRPGMVVPKVRLCKAPPPSFTPDKHPRKRDRDPFMLQVPKWRYKEAKEERRRREEEEERRRRTVLVIGRRR